MIYLYWGWGLNVVFYIIHILWCDKDPTHEDMALFFLLLMCFVPYLTTGGVTSELITQKILNIHHGVKRERRR